MYHLVWLLPCWAIWTERNAMWHGEGGRSVIGSVRWVLETTYDLAQIGKKKIDKPVQTKSQWKMPGVGVQKINVDASFIEAEQACATGLVVRDSSGGAK